MNSRRHHSPRLARRRKTTTSEALMLAAMVDMMINLLLFLLQLYGNSPAFLHPSDDLKLPRSRSDEPVQYAANVRVSQHTVEVDGDVVARFGPDGEAPTEDELAALKDRLVGRLPPSLGESQEPAELVVQADRSLAWDQLSPVLAVAGQAGFGDIRFVVSTTKEQQ